MMIERIVLQLVNAAALTAVFAFIVALAMAASGGGGFDEAYVLGAFLLLIIHARRLAGRWLHD